MTKLHNTNENVQRIGTPIRAPGHDIQCTINADHFSMWGRMAYYARSTISQNYRPELEPAIKELDEIVANMRELFGKAINAAEEDADHK